MLRNSRVAEQLVASQGLNSLELVSCDTGRGCISHERYKKFVQHFDRKSGREEEDHLEGRAAAGRIMFEKFKKTEARAWPGSIQLEADTSSRLL
jgi:hypothetical protein